jgi:CcmD family protein
MKSMTLLLSLLLAQPGQSEFLPVDQLPPADQLPAAPLLIAAYAFVWVAVFAYVWALWRRLGKVEHELNDLSRRIMPKRP